MNLYQRINNLTGWIVFLIAAVVYTLTLEPTTSFWDCGEFISACYKMQIMHPPGAPFFMLTGRMFTLLASDPMQVAWMVNFFSGLASAFTILFLFWTITAFGRKIIEKAGEEVAGGRLFALMGAGMVGALAYTFTDSFWFSAVEGEVYAYSSFFTAIVFWAILKWETVADEADSNRWLLLIAYLMGLSIGVHLLNLLAIPAICFVYYFKKHEVNRTGIIYTVLASLGILVFVQYGIIPGVPTLASKFDLLFVNSLGLPFGSGNAFFLTLLVAGVVYGIWYTHKHGKVLLNTALLATTFILIGYSSYTMIVIRSHANPSINMNNPSNIFSLVSYINREQYGDRPLLKGPYFTAEVIDQEQGAMKYRKGTDKYEEIGRDIVPIYDPAHSTIFPRAYRRAGTQQRHIDFYKRWLNLRDGQKPTFGQNLDFLFSYQLGHMYYRYFMWNFAGRQNDVQGQGMDYERGNWVSGIAALDEGRVGLQKNYPVTKSSNKGHNKYYGLPLLLGLIGLIYHYRKDQKDFWVVTFLFILTGIAINVYLNPEPLQPRERDYAYVGSFYAFAIWIGLGVMGLWDLLRKKAPETVAAAAVTAVCLVAVPGILAAENWDDHDRSGKYTARDFAINYLESCAPNAIIFTMGDNDTYPLWYVQEVEGFRTDVRVVNLSLLGTDWYINQLRRQINNSPAIKLSIAPEKIVMGVRDYVPFYDRKIQGAVDLRQVLQFATSDDNSAKLPTQGGEMVNYYPTKRFLIPVDKAAVLAQGAVTAADTANLLPAVEWEYPRNAILKNDLIVLDILANNGWERPIYWTVSMGAEQYLGLDDFFQLEGLAYRFVPLYNPSNGGQTSRVADDIMYENMVKKFKWGGMNTGIYIDPETNRMTINLRSNATRLAESLLAKGDKQRAVEVLDVVMKEMPHSHVPLMIFNYRMVELYHMAGASEKANGVAKDLFDMFEDEAKYFRTLRGKYATFYERDMQNAMAIMQEMVRMANQYGQTDLAKDFQARFDAIGRAG
ncbi:MAG: DUF2723 domain-containing protein [Sphingobacteriaceae bacterium]|nr:DUF2723 domain-containing protein [Sphingobacteriaceae bacterium]